MFIVQSLIEKDCQEKIVLVKTLKSCKVKKGLCSEILNASQIKR